ncbi:response regulator [Nocardioides sp.]|uniref:response regulator n=1 Tax=Nocardioides sp. TaxID=35761 RepID=UPI0026120206|nr:response regulator [Nocardioides sp.]
MRVLLAEDDADLREVAGMLLASWGCVVTAVADGGAAQDLLEHEERFDVLVLDFDMPVRSGLEVAVRARSLGHEGPVVVWTGWSGPVSQEQVERWGLVLMSKYDVYELGAVVSDLRTEGGPVGDVSRPLP